MAASGLAVIESSELRARVTSAARRVVAERFCTGVVVPMYEECYERLATRAVPGT
jgi:hypothetical protein